MTTSAPLTLTDLDRRIWDEELDEFVPQKVFDVHTHIYRWEYNRDPDKDASPYKALLGETWANATWDLCDACDAALMPGREVQRLAFPFPFQFHCDFEGSNQFLAEQLAGHPQSGGLMLVRPGMDPDVVEKEIDKYGFLGFKPYRFFSQTGDPVHCRLTDFMPENLIEVAHRRGLIIMMHLAKQDAVADPDNLADLNRLSERYPNAKWILAHCARSYSTWAIEAAGPHIRDLPTLWYDVSSVCESDAMEALMTNVPLDRVMYGSDDIPVGVLRGKYIAFGRAWAYLSPTNHSLGLSHCDGRMTFTRYEQLRAMRRAARRLGLTEAQRQTLFHDAAAALVASARGHGRSA